MSKQRNDYEKILNFATNLSFYKSNEIEIFPSINFPNKTSFFNFLNGCTNLKRVESIGSSNVIEFTKMFLGCTSLVSIQGLDTSKGQKFDGMFSGCSSLISIPMLDLTNATNVTGMFTNCRSLIDISFVENSIKLSISFAESINLSDESIQSIINGLATVDTAQTLTLHADVKAKLTESQIAQITSKNWTLA